MTWQGEAEPREYQYLYRPLRKPQGRTMKIAKCEQGLLFTEIFEIAATLFNPFFRATWLMAVGESLVKPVLGTPRAYFRLRACAPRAQARRAGVPAHTASFCNAAWGRF